VLRAGGETETMQENIQDWLQLDGDPGFQLLTEEEIVVVTFLLFIFLAAPPVLLHFPFIYFIRFLFTFRAVFCFITRDDLSPQLIQISERLLYLFKWVTQV
jgi:hypothetical protein